MIFLKSPAFKQGSMSINTKSTRPSRLTSNIGVCIRRYCNVRYAPAYATRRTAIYASRSTETRSVWIRAFFDFAHLYPPCTSLQSYRMVTVSQYFDRIHFYGFTCTRINKFSRDFSRCRLSTRPTKIES